MRLQIPWTGDVHGIGAKAGVFVGVAAHGLAERQVAQVSRLLKPSRPPLIPLQGGWAGWLLTLSEHQQS